MSMASDILSAAYSALTDAQCKVRLRNRDVITRAVCTGIDFASDPTEMGLTMQSGGTVRYLRADEPSRRASEGDIIEIKMAHMTKYQAVRVTLRRDIGGAVRLEVSGEFE